MIWKFYTEQDTVNVYADGVHVAVIRQLKWGGCRIETKHGAHISRNMVAAKQRVRGLISSRVLDA